MFRVFEVTGGFQIFWCPSWPRYTEDKVPHSAKIYPHKQAAHRRNKQLNDALEKTNAMIAEKGAIIL